MKDINMAKYWVIRTGRSGERNEWCFANNYAGGGWQELPNLSGITDREALRAIINEGFEGATKAQISNWTGQIFALTNRIEVGDWIVLPIRSTYQVAFGKVTGGYSYLANESDPTRRHVLHVEWNKSFVPKSAFKQDLLFQLGAATTIFAVENNDAAYRLDYIKEHGIDPGSRSQFKQDKPLAAGTNDSGSTEDLVTEDAVVDLDIAAQEAVGRLVQENFAGHGLSKLITALLEAEGFVCRMSPEGADGGVDILAARGMLGTESPKLVVQVKSQMSPVGTEVIAQVLGVMDKFKAEQALLVALGGTTQQAKRDHYYEWFRLRVWELQDVLDAIYKNYDVLPDDVQAKLPLKQIWIPFSESN
jgi:restriction system protein